MGLVYLIQPEKYVGTNIYRVGVTNLDTFDEIIDENGENHKIFHVNNSVDAFIIHELLIYYFNKKFKLVKYNSYFEGDIDEMRETYLYISLEFEKMIDHKILLTENNNNFENNNDKKQEVRGKFLDWINIYFTITKVHGDSDNEDSEDEDSEDENSDNEKDGNNLMYIEDFYKIFINNYHNLEDFDFIRNENDFKKFIMSFEGFSKQMCGKFTYYFDRIHTKEYLRDFKLKNHYIENYKIYNK